VETIDHIVCAGPLEAAVLEVRLIHRHQPPFNRQSKLWRRYAYVKLTLDERFPRLSVVRSVRRGDGCLYLGPLPSTATARQVAEAIESAVPLRRCTARGRAAERQAPCAPAQLGVAACPCAGSVTAEEYAAIVQRVVDGLTRDPAALLVPLEARMRALADAQRFEEAADVRDRAGALARALRRQRRLDGLRRAGVIELDVPGEGAAVIEGGVLVGDRLPLDEDAPLCTTEGPVPRELADELACVAAWLEARADCVQLLRCDGELTSALPRLPTYEPRGPLA
jgi:DNA polymerase-3 subunit epsilon